MPVRIKQKPHKVLQYFAQKEKVQPVDMRDVAKFLQQSSSTNKTPVGVEEFCLSRHYMNARDAEGKSVIWQPVMDALIEIAEGGYDEVVATGSVGSAKTTLCLYIIAYHVYLLSCFENPHGMFGLDPASEIAFVFQSLNANVAADVDFQRFKAMMDRSPYFQNHFMYDKTLISKLRFPNRIVCTPTATNIAGAIGQNVIGGLIDEINSMAVIEKSKRARRSEEGGIYDEAKVLYDVIDRRRQSRFDAKDRLPGILCLSSSKQYPGEFTDQKIEEAEKEMELHGRTTIYVYDKRVWDVRPEKYRDDPWFRIFVGDENHKPRILEEDEIVPDDLVHLVQETPESFRSKFEPPGGDIYGSLRDIQGVSTAARHPFIPDVESISKIFGKCESVLSLQECNFVSPPLEFFPYLFKNKLRKRWVHIDLGLTGDAAGVTCGYVSKFIKMERGDVMEILPQFEIDFILRVPPPKGGEILFYKIRDLIYKVRDNGLNIKWVSFDSFQSVDSIQVMRTKGFITGNVSVDKTSLPYDLTKTAIYDGRINAPKHLVCQKELGALERDPKKGTIDHPPYGSKDCADSLAGVVYGLTTRRETWGDFSVPITTIPSSIAEAMVKEEERQAIPKHPLRPKRA